MRRLGAPRIPVGYAPVLEAESRVGAAEIAAAARGLLRTDRPPIASLTPPEPSLAHDPLPDVEPPDEPSRACRSRSRTGSTVIIMALLALITFANVLVRYFTN